jgi:hypothetical protein
MSVCNLVIYVGFAKLGGADASHRTSPFECSHERFLPTRSRYIRRDNGEIAAYTAELLAELPIP